MNGRNDQMRRRAILCLALLLCLVGMAARGEQKTGLPPTQETARYTLYIGLNDQDTYEPVCSPGEALALVDEICLKYVDGFTSAPAMGGWLDEAGKITHEDTLVYILYGAAEDQVVAILDEVLSALNQSTVLVEVTQANILFYSGE